MNYYSGVLIITTETEILLQQRDNKPGIVNPGFVTTFGGLNKQEETPLQGAVRELTEETNLKIEIEDLNFFRHFYKTETDGTKTKVNIFILRNVSKEKLEIYEGKSSAVYIIPPLGILWGDKMFFEGNLHGKIFMIKYIRNEKRKN